MEIELDSMSLHELIRLRRAVEEGNELALTNAKLLNELKDLLVIQTQVALRAAQSQGVDVSDLPVPVLPENLRNQ